MRGVFHTEIWSELNIGIWYGIDEGLHVDVRGQLNRVFDGTSPGLSGFGRIGSVHSVMISDIGTETTTLSEDGRFELTILCRRCIAENEAGRAADCTMVNGQMDRVTVVVVWDCGWNIECEERDQGMITYSGSLRNVRCAECLFSRAQVLAEVSVAC